MTKTGPRTDFTPVQKRLHWAVVGLLLLQYLVFDHIGRAFRQTVETAVAVYSPTVIAHIVIGVAILGLAAWRLVLRLRDGAPLPPEAEPEIARTASRVAHGALYLLLFGLPLSGLAGWFLQSRLLGQIHEAGTTALMWLAAAHVAAVLVHEFWWKTAILRRMT